MHVKSISADLSNKKGQLRTQDPGFCFEISSSGSGYCANIAPLSNLPRPVLQASAFYFTGFSSSSVPS